MMGGLSRIFYLKAFEIAFLRKNGNEFQNFFSDIMEKRYPADFVRIMPWGKQGDRKNDGYLKSQKTLFQVYAPNEIKESKTISKIEEDFNSALPYWKKYFSKWIFVHNSRKGMSPAILKKLLEIQEINKEIRILNWGFEELKKEFTLLKDRDMEELCGKMPTEEDLEDLTFKELEEVIKTISRQKYPEGPIKPVSKEKLKFNSLSKDAENLLLSGMKKSNLVKKYFDECSDPKLGDEIAEGFNKKYRELKQEGLESDEIFTQLHIYAGGFARKEPRYEAAVLAVLAHLFEMCDIFENPKENFK